MLSTRARTGRVPLPGAPRATALALAMALACGGPAPLRAGPSGEALALGDRHDAGGRIVDARNAYAEAVRLAPSSVVALCRLARAESELGETQKGDTQRLTWAESVKHARDAVRLAPDSASTHEGLAVALGRQALREGPRARLALSREIKSEADRAIALDAASGRAWHVLAMWNTRIAGLNAFERMTANAVLGGVPKGASHENALRAFQKAIEIEPSYVHHHLEYARLLKELQRPADARRELEKALELKPTSSALDARYQAEARTLLENVALMAFPSGWILAGVRTPFAKADGVFKRTPSYELGRIAAAEVIARSDLDPARIDEVVFGHCAMPAEAANSSRVVALRAGVPERVPAVTVHRNCASGMEAVANACHRIGSGDAKLVLAGGMESMSQIPLQFRVEYSDFLGRLMRAKTPLAKLQVMLQFRPAMLTPRIALAEGLTDLVCGLNMGQTAEVLAREFRITRERQDEYALQSHQRAIAGRERLREEIVPVYPAPRYEPVRDDVGPREGQSMEALARLAPYFDRRNGTVTVGNSCQVTDGAAALLVGDDETAHGWPTPPLGRVRAFAFAGLSPQRMGLGPVFAMAKALARAQVTLTEIEVFEINEAFSAQVLACIEAAKSEKFCRDELGLDRPLGEIPEDRLNVNGGAIALGHPVGVSGARLLLTTLHEMRRRGARLGLASLCVGGGQGAAFVLERA